LQSPLRRGFLFVVIAQKLIQICKLSTCDID
jgi:hypothetical protein